MVMDKEEKKAYQKEYYKINEEKIKAYQKKYQKKRKIELLQNELERHINITEQEAPIYEIK